MGARRNNRKSNCSTGNDAGASEPNPRLIMAVVAIGVIVGALASPGKQAPISAVDTHVAAQP